MYFVFRFKANNEFKNLIYSIQTFIEYNAFEYIL